MGTVDNTNTQGLRVLALEREIKELEKSINSLSRKMTIAVELLGRHESALTKLHDKVSSDA